MSKATFPHNLSEPKTMEDIKEINGYSKCLRDVLNYLMKTTEYKPENRYIDAVPLLELIEETSKEIKVLYTKTNLLTTQS